MPDFETARRNLVPLEPQEALEEDTDERFSPERVSEFESDPEMFESRYNQPTHHYNQTQDWGGSDALETLLNRHELTPEDLQITIFGGFTGEFSCELRNLGCDIIFTDPMSEWTERAQDEGFTTYTCPAESIPSEVLTQSDAVATFECYYPLQCSARYALYTALRFLTVPNGLLFAETESTRSVRQEQGAKCASLAIYNELRPHIDVEQRYHEMGNLRLYRYYQPEDKRHQSVRLAEILRYLYDYGSDETTTEVDEDMLQNLIDDVGSDRLTVTGDLRMLVHMYRDLLGGMAEFTPPRQLTICNRTFDLSF